MPTPAERLSEFATFAGKLRGDEKSEGQAFCERLFRAFEHEGVLEAGARFEERVRQGASVTFADLVWPGKLLIEMKKRGTNLGQHYDQAFDYWLHLTPNRPKFVILCNFDEFWIYDLNRQLYHPVDIVPVSTLLENYKSLQFLYPQAREPQFRSDRVKLTRSAASFMADLYNQLTNESRIKGPIAEERAQRYVLQCLIALFAEDSDLLPDSIFSNLVTEARKEENFYDLIGGLFRQMNDDMPAAGGRYFDVEYFNGGIFSIVEPIDLGFGEGTTLFNATKFDWSQVEPEIFGTLFEDTMGKELRHVQGAHYTNRLDIMKVVRPTIRDPWRAELAKAASVSELTALHTQLSKFRVLDPACGSGNFLYLAYTELKRIERSLFGKLLDIDAAATKEFLAEATFVSTRQFFGIDTLEFAVELAKVTLMIAKELSVTHLDELDPRLAEMINDREKPLPLDNMDSNILRQDAILEPWPEADAIIGNPPFQSKNKMQEEFGASYVEDIRNMYPDMPGRADFCVYWFRKAHDSLKQGARAGLVGTNTIRQNFSREGGLDYIVSNGGTITDAVSSQEWSGEANVHVSIVNWVKGDYEGRRLLSKQVATEVIGHGTEKEKIPVFETREVEVIPASLTFEIDVTQAVRLRTNMHSKACFQGQTHGHAGFLVPHDEAGEWIRKDSRNGNVLFPFMTADELLGFIPNRPQKTTRSRYQTSLFAGAPQATEQLGLAIEIAEVKQTPVIESSVIWYPERLVIDFGERDMAEASSFQLPYQRLSETALVKAIENANEEREELGENAPKGPRQQYLESWWRMWRRRPDLISQLIAIPRYIVCGRVTKRPIFEFVSSRIRPNDALAVFPMSDDYSFGILESFVHWKWFTERCSTLKGDNRYTSDSVFDTFVWPQSLSKKQALAVASAAVDLRNERRILMLKHGLSLRTIYRLLDKPGKLDFRDALRALHEAVAQAYEIQPGSDPLPKLLALNFEAAIVERDGGRIVPPGLPQEFHDDPRFYTDDCVVPAM